MPLLQSNYLPPRILRHGDFHTSYPHFLGCTKLPPAIRSTLTLADGDEIEIFEHRTAEARGVVVISHGLEGSVSSPYISDMVTRARSCGFAAISWNMRGCGSAPNKLLTWYHSGFTNDLVALLGWVERHPDLAKLPLYLVGFSIGGNITLKLLSETNTVLPQIVAAVCISVPVDLAASAITLSSRRNRRYMRYLLGPLKARMRRKAKQFPGQIDLSGLSLITTFREFDSRYTAPLHGFSSVDEYWSSQSSLYLLPKINTPTLLLSARDDPFLAPTCFPEECAKKSSTFFAEYPTHGGHVGFLESIYSRKRWASLRAMEFFGARN